MVRLVTELIFVGGSPRSGTTLMQTLLTSGPETNPSLGEAKFLGHYLYAYQESKRVYDAHNRDYFESISDLQTDNKTFLNSIFERLADKHKVAKLVIKCPNTTRFLPEFLELFPEVRCVLMVRDFRDLVVSLLQVGQRLLSSGLESNHTMANLNGVVNHLHQHYEPIYPLLINEQYNAQIHLVHYEHLVSEPEEVFASLQAFTGLDTDLLELNKNWRHSENDSTFEKAWQSPLNGKPISAQSVGQYQSKLTREQIWLIERNARDYFQTFGYTPDVDNHEQAN